MANYLEANPQKSITVPSLSQFKTQAEKITVLTCYDASFAALMERCGIDILLVGDSLGMVCQGHASTLTVTINDMTSVARGNQRCLIIADMPFGTYATPESAMNNAVQLIQAGAQMVKLEGGTWLAPTIQFLTERSVPVCAHLGLTPQSVHKMGGYKVQGKTNATAEALKKDALAIQAAGASLLVLEGIPKELAQEITDSLTIPTIGIGAGPACSGQVLVMHDLLGVFPGKKARFVKNFMEGQTSIEAAIKAYVTAVKEGSFPAEEHCF
jgi:3-methyl-2-oxobutanoate hydroxymethyltransferase